MRIIKYLLSAALFGASIDAFGQYNIKMPDLLPASPEVSGFIKAGYGGVNMSTGAVSVNVPLYTLKVKGLSWPISISYSSQGLKLDEACSRVGHGWTLNAAGVISRTVKDDPDEVVSRLTMPSNLGTVDSANFFYALNASSESNTRDSEPDVYHFNFNGQSGKFVFDNTGNAIVTSHSNLKIERISAHHFVITTTDGVRYKFGNNEYEKTNTHNMNTAVPYKNSLRTAYFLYQVEIPGGNWINLNYNSITTQVATGITQTATKFGYPEQDPCNICPPNSGITYTTNTNTVEYATRYLTSITTSSGQVVDFSYQARPDLSDDNRLSFIYVSNDPSSGSVETVKAYKFNYYDPPGFDGSADPGGNARIIGRFFLTKLIDFPVEDIVTPDSSAVYYQFTYHNLERHTGKPISTQQDYFGFYNGNTGNLLVPENDFSTSSYVTGNRTVNHDSTKNGILTSVRYPTGGTEEFYYEGNTVLGSLLTPNPLMTIELEGNHQGGSTYYSYYSSPFSVPFDQTATLMMNSAYYGGEPNYTPEQRIVQYYLIESGDTAVHHFLNGNSSASITRTFYANKIYRMELKIRQNWQNQGTFSVSLDTLTGPRTYTGNVPTGGVRLRKIRYTNPGTGTAFNKFYHYHQLETPQYTSGYGREQAYYYSQATYSNMCDVSGSLGEYAICKYSILNSNTSYNVFKMSGSHMNYRHVIESDDSLFANGGTEYTFSNYDEAGNGELVWGNEIQNMPYDNYGTLNGQIERIRKFDSSKAVVRDQVELYGSTPVSGKWVYGAYVRRKYTPVYNPNNLANEMKAFDIVRYRYWDQWWKKTSTITHTYENGMMMADTVHYVYDSADNILPVEVINVDSKGGIQKTIQKYPTDFSTTPVYNQMISRNMIAAPIETHSYYNGVLQQQQVSKYKNLFTGDLYLPDTVQVKKSQAATLKDELFYDRYDSSGNILQAHKKDDAPVVYIWDHLKTFPIAEVKYATYGQIAYTSFEADGWGNWKKPASSGTIHTTAGYTGGKSYTGTLYDTINIAGDYILTLWTSSGTPTVNGQSGTSVMTKNGWTLYQWSLANPTNIAVSGTNMDEVRLYPKGAFVTTYTYYPMIGIRSQCDLNNRVTRYEYDEFKRLSLIRDEDNNIIKKVCYNYAGQPQACGATIYSSVAKSGTFTRNNCGTNGTGTSVPYNVAAGAYTSIISQADADQKAQNDVNANGQAHANFFGSCTWTNQVQSGSFTRNNCGTNGTGSTVTYTVEAGNYTSTISLADANQQAMNAVNAGGQAYANTNAGCTWYNQAQSGNFTRNNCTNSGVGGTISYPIAAGTYTSTISLADANQQAINAVNAGGQAYANANATCTWYNWEITGTFYKQCSAGYVGTSINYTVPANTYSSTISWNDAHQQALNALNTNGQAQANAQGSCQVDCAIGCVGNDKKCINNVCTTGIAVEVDCEFDPETNKYKHWFKYHFPDGSWSGYTYYVIQPTPCSID